MALTDEQIDGLADKHISSLKDAPYFAWHDYARAIEAAASAPLLERIAEMDSKQAALEHALADCREAFRPPAEGSKEERAWREAMGDPECVPGYIRASIAALEAKVEQAAQPSEQAAFEDWLHRVCPSGDVTDVKRQWEASSDLAEWLESQRTEDVLIDGVAYTVPIEVACELLHLHMALLTKPAQAAQPVYQVREAFVDDPAGTWRDTWEGPFYMVPEADRRIVYTSQPKAAPLTISEDDAFNLAKHVYAHSQPYDAPQILLTGKELKAIIESATNGITPAAVEKG